MQQEPRTVLQDAEAAVRDRGDSYGHPSENHARTAKMWSAFLGVEIDARQVCMMNILQKCSRDASGTEVRDTLVDIAGYARNAELLAEKIEKTLARVDPPLKDTELFGFNARRDVVARCRADTGKCE